MENSKHAEVSKGNFNKDFDLETTDHTRIQSLQVLDTHNNNITDPMIESYFLNAEPKQFPIQKIDKSSDSFYIKKQNSYKILFQDSSILSDSNYPEKKCSFISFEGKSYIENQEISENVDFFPCDSPQRPSVPITPSLTYSKTDMGILESVFDTLLWQSGLIKSLPQSRNESQLVQPKCWDSLDPCFLIERKDIGKYDYENFGDKKERVSSNNEEGKETLSIEDKEQNMEEFMENTIENDMFKEGNTTFEGISNCCKCRYENCIIL